jgi:CDGSH-type Zn-finger protein
MQAKKSTKCTVFDNKSIMIEGDFIIIDAKGNEIKSTNPAFLCRCGHSNNKPFCDGRHREVGFEG